MHIGLIGGIGPAATAVYYERIVRVFAAAEMPLHLTIGHTSVQNLSRNSSGGFADRQAIEYKRIAEQLAAAGADLIAITSMGGHFCVKEFVPISPLPVVEGPAAVAAYFKGQSNQRSNQRIGIIGTGNVMRSRLYGALSDLDVVTPIGEALDRVNDDYIAIAIAGSANDEQRERLLAAGSDLIQTQGAQVVLLGGTDLSLAYTGASLDFPVLDSALIHADAISQAAMKT